MHRNRIVVKLGTSTLTGGTSQINLRRLLSLAQQVVALRESGSDVIVVSSGAMAAGRSKLGLSVQSKSAMRARSIPYKQMLAAVGQASLMTSWDQVFAIFEVHVAQVLLTRDDLGDRQRYLNARNTLDTILSNGIVPVVNENDAIATEEIRIGDNDNLSALVANAVHANLLVILSDIDGLFTSDPRKNPSATLIPEVVEIDDDLRSRAGVATGGLGTGGMATKLQAAELAMRAGITTVLARGDVPNVLVDIANGVRHGTRFVPIVDHLESRKRWLLGEKPLGALVIDAGAARALRSGRSLLAVGVNSVLGDFKSGEVIGVRDLHDTIEFARGIARCSSIDARRMAGMKSSAITEPGSEAGRAVIVHADDLVVL